MAVRAQDDPQYRMEIGAGVGAVSYTHLNFMPFKL